MAELADLVLQRECAGCGRARVSWCEDCAQSLAGAPEPRLLRPTPDLGAPSPGLTVWSCGDYADPVRSAVVAWKDRGRADLTSALVQPLRRAVVAALHGRPCTGPVLLVPAPSSRRSRRERGREPVRALALRCVAALGRRGVDVQVVPALTQARVVQDQAGLGVAARSRNLAGALRVPVGWTGLVAGRDCVLVDDVVTTGVTLLECARALTHAGANVHAAATVAATRLLTV